MSSRKSRVICRVGQCALAVTMAAALASGTAGCGGGDDDSADAGATAALSGRNPDPPARRPGAEEIDYERAQELADKDNDALGTGSRDESKIVEGLEDIQIGVAEVAGQNVCHELTPTAQIAMAQTIGKNDPLACSDAVNRYAERRRKRKGTTALSEVVSVEVRGSNALARVRDPGGGIRHLPFVEVDGRLWRAPSLEVIEPTLVERPSLGIGRDYDDPAGVSEREQIKELLYDLESKFPIGFTRTVCLGLTPAGQREIGGGVSTCEARLPLIVRRAMLRGYRPHFSRFRSLDITGRRAVAVVKSPGRPVRRVRFVKTREGWRLPSVRYAGNVDPLLLREPVHKPDLAGVAKAAPRHDLGDASGGPRVQIREVIRDIQIDFAEGIGGVCPELSLRGERELNSAPGLSACTAVASELSRLVRGSRTLAPWHSRVLSIEVNGRRATALLGTPGRGRHRALFVEDPQRGWRAESLLQLEPVAGLLPVELPPR